MTAPQNDRMADVIQQLADKLGVSAQYLWAALLRQAHYEAIQYLLWGIFWAALSVTVAIYGRPRIVSRVEFNDPTSDWWLNFFILAACGVASLAAYSLFWNAYVISQNPQFWALRSLLGCGQ